MDSGKADIATQFPSVCKNVKPKPVSVGKNVNRRGAVQARGPALPRTCPSAKGIYFWVRRNNGTKCWKDTELGQNDVCRGVVVLNGLVSSQQQGWIWVAMQRHPQESPRTSPLKASPHRALTTE